MEFKKPNRYNRGRLNLNAPRPGVPQLTASPLVQRPIQPSPRDIQNVNPADQTSSPTPETSRKKATFSDFLPSKAMFIALARRLFSTKKAIIITSSITLIAISLIALLAIHQYDISKNTDHTNLSAAVDSLEYQTILPDGKSINDLGGWKRVSPSKSDPVYAYIDTIGETSINVSEQPLPKSFIGDTDDQVAELAKKFSATNKVDAEGITIYVGTSSKGPQSAIFTKNSLLVLIKSQEKIDDASWISYVKSLN